MTPAGRALEFPYRPRAAILIGLLVLFAVLTSVGIALALTDDGTDAISILGATVRFDTAAWTLTIAAGVLFALCLAAFASSRNNMIRLSDSEIAIDSNWKKPHVVIPVREIAGLAVEVSHKQRHLVIQWRGTKSIVQQDYFPGEAAFEQFRERLGMLVNART